MRFIVGRLTLFSPEVEFWSSLFKLYVILNSEQNIITYKTLLEIDSTLLSYLFRVYFLLL